MNMASTAASSRLGAVITSIIAQPRPEIRDGRAPVVAKPLPHPRPAETAVRCTRVADAERDPATTLQGRHDTLSLKQRLLTSPHP
jgi:hypothetical protein